VLHTTHSRRQQFSYVFVYSNIPGKHNGHVIKKARQRINKISKLRGGEFEGIGSVYGLKVAKIVFLLNNAFHFAIQ